MFLYVIIYYFYNPVNICLLKGYNKVHEIIKIAHFLNTKLFFFLYLV